MPAIRLSIELDTARPRKDGTCALRMVITGGGRARHPLDLFIRPDQWDRRRQRVKVGAAHAHAINGRIEADMARAQELAIERPGISPQALRDALREPASPTLADAVRQVIADHGHRISYGTQKQWRSLLLDLERHLPRVRLSSITRADIVALDRAYVGRGLHTNTRRSRLKKLRTLYRQALRTAGLQDAGIFEGLIPAEVDTGARYLTADEVKALQEVQSATPMQALARDAWLLSMHLGGIRFGDLCRLRREWLTDGGIEWTVGKVQRRQWAPVNAQALEIIGRYDGDHLLPLLRGRDNVALDIESANAKCNDALKSVCKLAGIRPVTMHMARHTWAVMAKAATGDIHAVSRILGHSKTSTTERYLNRFDRDAVAEVFAKLNAPTPKGDG